MAKAAAELLAAGKIDQSQYLILMKLSNEGHKVAQIQSMINDAVNLSNGDYTKFSNTKFSWNGQTYTGPELTKLIGFEGPQPSTFATTDILTATGTAEPEMANFLSLYQQAVSSGALADPSAKSTVVSASTQIASIGELTEDTIYNYSIGNANSPAAVKTMEASRASDMSSAHICTAGNFHDSGALCSL